MDGDGYLTESDLIASATRLSTAMLDKVAAGDATGKPLPADVAEMLTTAADLMPRMSAVQWRMIGSIARLDDQGRLTRDEFARITDHLMAGETDDAHNLVFDATWHLLHADGEDFMRRDDWHRFAEAHAITRYVDDLFDEMDSDHDGKVSKDDYLAVRSGWDERA
ncbi:EF hand [Actinokineospora sp. UTMC 2448]|nr:EF hand [Actinokineospora sp. UTMC 2448]